MQINTYMFLKKSTKGTHVYEDKEENPAIPTLYVRKDHLPKPPPDRITVVIVLEDE